MLNDLRFALRQLFRHRGSTAVAVLTLALGIGANTAIFSVVHSVLIAPMPYPDPERLVMVFETIQDGGLNSVSGGAFKDWAEHGAHFSELAVFEDVLLNLTGHGAPERVEGLRVSANFLTALGVAPQFGRDFLPGDDQPGAENDVVLLTHELWSVRFGGRKDILGQQVQLDQIPHTVVGVLPPAALFRDRARVVVPTVIDGNPDAWTRSGHWRNVLGRLQPHASCGQAEADLRAVKAELNTLYPPFKEDWSVAVVPLQEVFADNLRPTLGVLFGTVALVLLIACANVSNLLLVRGSARAREMAIRTSLGAHRGQLVRQLLTESLLLAMVGCGAGLLVAEWGIDLLANRVVGDLPEVLRPELSPGVLAFSIGLAGTCGLLFGILPALRSSRGSLNQELETSGRGMASRFQKRSQAALVVAEFALTVVLLVGAGLFLRSFVILLDVDPGFDPRQTLAMDLSFPDAKYPTPDARLAFIHELQGRLGALPGVESVGTTSSLPLSRTGRTEFASRADQPPRTDYVVGCNFISDGYFEAMGTALVAGRGVRGGQSHGAAPHEVVIDAHVARELYPDESPLGKSLRFLRHEWEIVGVVEPVRHFVLDRDAQPAVYLPQAHAPEATSVVLRTASTPSALVAAVRKTVQSLDPDQPIANIRTLEHSMHEALAGRRTPLILLGLFAAVALGLACLGVYGVMAFTVAQQSRELGIRTALGAQRFDIYGMILAEGMKPTALGLGAGLLGALALTRLVESQLYAVAPHDPLVLSGSMVLLTLLAVVSILVPARRAALAEPVEILREE